MAKPELGTKRLCGSCGAKFYDLSKTPIVCPKCDTVMALAAVPSRAAPGAAPPPRGRAGQGSRGGCRDAGRRIRFARGRRRRGAGQEGRRRRRRSRRRRNRDRREPIDDAALIEETGRDDDDVTDIIGEREDKEEEP